MGCIKSSSGTGSSSLYFNKLKSDPPGSSKKICLLLIDPQNDFVLSTGALSVPGAEDDCQRVAKGISANLANIDNIFITLDTHQKYHIAHAMFWMNEKGERPPPFATITLSDVQERKWFTDNREHQAWAEHYIRKLKQRGKFDLTIWPEHCLVGTPGHVVYEPLMASIHEWEKLKKTSSSFILKGSNAFTEHYSALKAEVEMEQDPRTALNVDLIAKLKQYDRIVIAGEALSHCVNFTVRDLIANVPKVAHSKIWIVSDGCSSVAGYEEAGAKFIEEMKHLGVRFMSAEQAFAHA